MNIEENERDQICEPGKLSISRGRNRIKDKDKVSRARAMKELFKKKFNCRFHLFKVANYC